MENTELLTPETAQAMYEIAGIVIALVISMVGMYIRNFLKIRGSQCPKHLSGLDYQPRSN